MAANDQLLVVRVLLRQARRFQQDADKSAAAIRGIGASARDTARHFDFASTRTFLLRQALFTLRRVIYSATLAVGGLGAAVVTMGFKFNSGMEQAQIAMTQFLGSARLARRELNTLFQLAATTPFTVSNIRAAATEFLGFGFNVRQTNKYLRILGDVVSGLPQLGAEGIGRLAVVFGQIRASGRLLGQDLLQLTQAGVPAIEILTKQLRLTRSQVQDLLAGNLRIPSNVAIPALFQGLQERFGGLARKQAQTFEGLRSTALDYFSRLSGILTHPLFVRTERLLRRDVNPLLTQLTKAFGRKPGGDWDAFFRTLDQGVGANGRLYDAWLRMSAAARNLWQIIRSSLVPALRDAWSVVSVVAPIFSILGDTLAFAARHTTALRLVLTPLLTYFLLAKAYVLAYRLGVLAWTIAVGAAGRALRLWWIAQGLTIGALRALDLATVTSTRLWRVLTVGYIRGANGQFLAMTKLEKVALRLRYAMLAAIPAIRAATAASLAFVLSPVGLMVAAVVALAAGFVILYLRVKRFRDFVNRYWPYLIAGILPMVALAVEIRRHWDDLVSFFTTLPGRIASSARGMFDGIKEAFRAAINWIIRGWNRLHFHIPGFSFAGVHIGGFDLGLPPIPQLALGGRFQTGGAAIVGERGAELANFPRGATVTPLTRGPGDDVLAGITEQLSRIAAVLSSIRGDVFMDGQKVGVAAWNQRAEARARA